MCALYIHNFLREEKYILRLIGGDLCQSSENLNEERFVLTILSDMSLEDKSSHRISHGGDFVHSVEEVVNTRFQSQLLMRDGYYVKKWLVLWVNGYYNASAFIILQDKVVKFANYFLSRKHVHQLRAAYQLVSVIKTLTDNQVSLYPVWF